jgi:large subunit ribosomal protein L30
LLNKEVSVCKEYLTDNHITMSKVKLTLVKSTIKRTLRQKRTVEALGLGKLHSSVEHEATPQIKGMITKVGHLLKVENI